MKKYKKLLSVLTVCALSVSLAGCGNTSKGPGSSKDGNEQKVEKASMKLVSAVEKGKYKLVSTEELKKWIDEKQDMIIVDTMPKESYEKNKIPGAVNALLPVKMEDVKPEEKEAFLKTLGDDKDKKIVLYCGFVACERSHVGAMIAKEAGFKNVYRHPGGIVAWMDAGYNK